ncbi:MAG: rod shape-determining protein MreD [Bacteroidales bacterium]
MIKELPRYLILFVVLVALQLLVLNNINLGGYINPYIYLLFILLLPFSIPGWLLLAIGFLTGFTVDYFMGTLGLHASATLVLAFFRPTVLSRLSYRNDIDKFDSPDIVGSGMEWFVRYVIIMVAIHHLALFGLEVFSFYHFYLTLLRVLLSTLFSSFFIIIFELLYSRRK